METKYAHIRLFLQIWDSRESTIAWKGMQELRQAAVAAAGRFSLAARIASR